RIGLGGRARRGAGGQRRREGHLDGEARAAAYDGNEIDLVVEHARDALDDRQTKTEAGRRPGAFGQAMEFLEDLTLLRGRNADAGVPDVDPQASAPAAAADQHAALGGVF